MFTEVDPNENIPLHDVDDEVYNTILKLQGKYGSCKLYPVLDLFKERQRIGMDRMYETLIERLGQTKVQSCLFELADQNGVPRIG